MDSPVLQSILIAFGVVALLAIATAAAILWWLHSRLKLLRIARDTGLGETLRAVPFALVLALDLLDMGLNLFSAPLVWILFHRMGWHKLRNLATAAAAIPGTQLVPVLSIAWIVARIAGRRADRLLEAAQDAHPKDRPSAHAKPPSSPSPP